jgi:hypothetical protein
MKFKIGILLLVGTLLLLYLIYYAYPSQKQKLQEATEDAEKMSVKATIISIILSIVSSVIAGIILLIWILFGEDV